MFGARRVAFGTYAAAYDAVRPGWPAETVAWMLGSPTSAAVCRVVDLGAGTGIGTRAIAALGHEVIAVEDLVLHASTWSYVAIHHERDRILDDVRMLGQSVADADGMVDIPMTTRCYRLRRR